MRGLSREPYLAFEAVQVKCPVQSSNKLARQWLAALCTDPHLPARSAPTPLARRVPLAALARVAVPVGLGERRAAGARYGRPDSMLAVWCPVTAAMLVAIAPLGGIRGWVVPREASWHVLARGTVVVFWSHGRRMSSVSLDILRNALAVRTSRDPRELLAPRVVAVVAEASSRSASAELFPLGQNRCQLVDVGVEHSSLKSRSATGKGMLIVRVV